MRSKLIRIYILQGWSMGEAEYMANRAVDKLLSDGYSEEEINEWPAWKVIPY